MKKFIILVLILANIIIFSFIGYLLFADNFKKIDQKKISFNHHKVEMKDNKKKESIPNEIRKKYYTLSNSNKNLSDIQLADLRDYVCVINTEYSQGSGVLISDDGYIITNCHVVDFSDNSIRVGFGRNDNEYKEYNAKLIDYDDMDDLSLLKVDAKFNGCIKLSNRSNFDVGEKIAAIGSPEGQINTVSFGHVTGIRKDGRVIQTDTAVSPGSSGGALLDSKGCLLGLTTFKIEDGENLNFAMSKNLIVGFLNNVEEGTPFQYQTADLPDYGYGGTDEIYIYDDINKIINIMGDKYKKEIVPAQDGFSEGIIVDYPNVEVRADKNKNGYVVWCVEIKGDTSLPAPRGIKIGDSYKETLKKFSRKDNYELHENYFECSSATSEVILYIVFKNYEVANIKWGYNP